MYNKINVELFRKHEGHINRFIMLYTMNDIIYLCDLMTTPESSCMATDIRVRNRTIGVFNDTLPNRYKITHFGQTLQNDHDDSYLTREVYYLLLIKSHNTK